MAKKRERNRKRDAKAIRQWGMEDAKANGDFREPIPFDREAQNEIASRLILRDFDKRI